MKADGIFAGRAAQNTEFEITFNEYMVDSGDYTEDTLEFVRTGVLEPEEAKEKLGLNDKLYGGANG